MSVIEVRATEFERLAFPSLALAFMCSFASSLVLDCGQLFRIFFEPALVWAMLTGWIWFRRRKELTAGDRFILRYGYFVLVPLTTVLGGLVQAIAGT
jgi:hypothetical protein